MGMERIWTDYTVGLNPGTQDEIEPDVHTQQNQAVAFVGPLSNDRHETSRRRTRLSYSKEGGRMGRVEAT